MNNDSIYITWHGETKRYESSDWLSPKIEAFKRFLYKNDEDENLKVIEDYINACMRSYEKPLFSYDGRTKTPEDRMNTSIADAEQMMNSYLKYYRDHLTERFSIARIFDVEGTYDPEYEDPCEVDLVCDALADIIGWKIWGNPWNDNLIDEQYMGVSMHREGRGSLRYNWYMYCRYPDFLVDEINLDKMFDNAAIEVANREIQFEEFA